MKPTRVFKDRQAAYADLVQYDMLLAEGVMKLKEGSLMAAFEFRGPDLANSSPEQVNDIASRMARALGQVPEQFVLHIDHVRAPVAEYPVCQFPDAATALLDAVRSLGAQQEGARYASRQVMTLTWLPAGAVEKKFMERLLSGDPEQVAQDEVGRLRRDLESFQSRFRDLVEAVKKSVPGSVVTPLSSKDLLSHLQFCTTGLLQPVTVPEVPLFMDYLLCGQDFYGGIQPMIGRKHVRCLSIEGLPDYTSPAMLDLLTKIPVEYRWSTRWIPHSQEYAKKLISRTQKHWSDAEVSSWDKMSQAFGGRGSGRINTDAAKKANDADVALNIARGGNVRFGFYTGTLVFMGEDKRVLNETVRDTSKSLMNLGFRVRNEEFNCVEAFLGSLPGHAMENVRLPAIHTRNLSDLVALHSIWLGHETSPNPMLPSGSPALIYAATSGDTPFRVNLHVGGVGHTTVVGPSGAGKSTLLAALMAQFFRYYDPARGLEPQVFMFDKGASSYVLCQAAGGEFYDLAAEQGDTTSFAPLVDVDQPTERAWAESWIEELILLQSGETRLEPAVRAEIRRALELLAQSPRSARTLTDLVTTLSSPFPGRSDYFREMLSEYLIDSDSVSGRMLDAAESNMGSARFQVFELDHLMNLGPLQTLPVLSYLFHAIERRLDGRPTLIVLDEAWLMLKHEFFKEKIEEWIRVLRRSNAAIVFATQNINDIVGSPLAATILSNCATKIWLPNSTSSSMVLDFYRQAGLTETQISIICSVAQKQRDYLLCNEDGTRLFQLALDPLQVSILAASQKPQVARARQLVAEHGKGWLTHWLKEKGFEDWAQYYERSRHRSAFFNTVA